MGSVINDITASDNLTIGWLTFRDDGFIIIALSFESSIFFFKNKKKNVVALYKYASNLQFLTIIIRNKTFKGHVELFAHKPKYMLLFIFDLAIMSAKTAYWN